MLHAASSAQLRTLKVTDIDMARRTVKLSRRRYPVPLGPATWQAWTGACEGLGAVVESGLVPSRGRLVRPSGQLGDIY